MLKGIIKAIFVESSVPKKSIEALQEAVKAKGKENKNRWGTLFRFTRRQGT